MIYVVFEHMTEPDQIMAPMLVFVEVQLVDGQPAALYLRFMGVARNIEEAFSLVLTYVIDDEET